VICDSFLAWATNQDEYFDIAVGNPPFVRFQFVDPSDRDTVLELQRQTGAEFRGVSNLWAPIFVGALSKLVDGGAFAFVLPTECLTGVSAKAVRDWLVSSTRKLRVDLFPPNSFPEVLQEVLVLSGERWSGSGVDSQEIDVFDHEAGLAPRRWAHRVSTSDATWTGGLLSGVEAEAARALSTNESLVSMSTVARFTVSTVTGANNYFCLSEERVEANSLGMWAEPLLARLRNTAGLVHTPEDQANAVKTGLPAFILAFYANREDPESFADSSAYLRLGESLEIDRRFKCRTRKPWYRVPVVLPGELMLSKRTDKYPRMVLNQARVITTDTIYRGVVDRSTGLVPEDLAASFHNSLTGLSFELSGRSFGGGVLEVVPSEISRLRVPLAIGFGRHTSRLDKLSREAGGQVTEQLVAATDALLREHDKTIDSELQRVARQAAESLRLRRTDRLSRAA